jgi:hypothetical protein
MLKIIFVFCSHISASYISGDTYQKPGALSFILSIYCHYPVVIKSSPPIFPLSHDNHLKPPILALPSAHPNSPPQPPHLHQPSTMSIHYPQQSYLPPSHPPYPIPSNNSPATTLRSPTCHPQQWVQHPTAPRLRFVSLPVPFFPLTNNAPQMHYPVTPAPIVEEKRGLRIVRDPSKKPQRVWCGGIRFSWFDCLTGSSVAR